MLDIALEYVERGWAVFPLHSIDSKGQCTCGKSNCADAGKHPRVRRGVKEASKDTDKLTKWFGDDAPHSNIAIATGEISGITVIDIDIGPGKRGAESWAEAISEHGEPVTLMAQTGSGGMHVVFQYNSSLKTASNVLGKGVDCRNDGGYIVGAPSLHASGGSYSWLNDVQVAVLPAHLSRRKETRGRPKKGDLFRAKYSIGQVKSMLEVVSPDDRDTWRSIGIILGREFERADEAWEVYQEWSNKWGGRKGRNHDEIMRQAFYDLSQQGSAKELTVGTIVKLAIDNGWSPKTGDVPISNFVFFAPGNSYIYRPTVTQWVGAAVDAAVSPVNESGKIIKASDWLRQNQLATSMTCDPALTKDYIKGFDCREGEIVDMDGAAVYNSYRRSTLQPGDARLAQPFVEHVKLLLDKEGDADQFMDYMAQRVQAPEEKPRFALLIAGEQGTGKDTAVEFCAPALGVWNVANIEPMAFDSQFNEFAAATLVRVSETANLHEMSKWAFNERTKVLIAGNPDYCTVNPKYGTKYSVRLHCGVILTTNHLVSGIYIPPDDRRYDVMECATLEEMKLSSLKDRRQYFEELWEWFLGGGSAHVAAYLLERDIKKFSASNGQRRTSAHHTVVTAGMVGDQWLDDILDHLKYPTGIRSDWIMTQAASNGEREMDVRRKLANTIGRAGYVTFKCPTTKDGRWRLNGKKAMVYVKSGTPADYDPVKHLSEEPF